MLSAVFEFVPDEAYSVEVGSHCELLIFNLRFLGGCTFLRQCLVVKGKGKNYVASDFACVKFAVEASKFNRMVSCEKAVEVKEVVAALMVVLVSRISVAFVPNVLDAVQGLRLFAVHRFNKVAVHLLAEPCSVGVDLECLVEKVVL